MNLLKAYLRHATAEDTIEALRSELMRKLALADTILQPLYAGASGAQQILMTEWLDEAREAERLLGALAVAKRHLTRPLPPKTYGPRTAAPDA